MAIDLGDQVPLGIETRDSNGVLANAGTVVLAIGLPDLTTVTVVTPTLTNPSTGRYQYDYPTTQVGHHTVSWLATGVNASAFADSFDVSSATPGYIVSLARAKRKLKIDLTATDADEDIRDYIEAATSVIERYRKETIVTRSVTEEHMLRQWVWELPLFHTPVRSLTSVATVDGTLSWNVSDLHVDPDTGVLTVVRGVPLRGSPIRGALRVVLVAGRAVIPAHYQKAALIIVEHLWQTERAQSDAGPFPGAYEDSMIGLQRRAGIGYAIPNRALELLGTPPPQVA